MRPSAAHIFRGGAGMFRFADQGTGAMTGEPSAARVGVTWSGRAKPAGFRFGLIPSLFRTAALFFAGAFLLVAALAQPALAGPKSESPSPLGDPVFAPHLGSEIETDPVLAFSAPGARSLQNGGLAAALPQPASPDTVLDAVTVDLPVWPWSTPVDRTLDDPAQGYNFWTYGFALLLIGAGLALGRRKEPGREKPAKTARVSRQQPSAAD